MRSNTNIAETENSAPGLNQLSLCGIDKNAWYFELIALVMRERLVLALRSNFGDAEKLQCLFESIEERASFRCQGCETERNSITSNSLLGRASTMDSAGYIALHSSNYESQLNLLVSFLVAHALSNDKRQPKLLTAFDELRKACSKNLSSPVLGLLPSYAKDHASYLRTIEAIDFSQFDNSINERLVTAIRGVIRL